jgi:hypothetical protein
MRRSALRALVEALDAPLVVALKHHPRCPRAGKIHASGCDCETVVEQVPRDKLDAFEAEEERLRAALLN